MTQQVTDADLGHLRRCVQLAVQAVEAGDFPFGSVLVAADGTGLAEDRNLEVTTGDPTRHPEFALTRWAATNMTPPERAAATVYTSGEHCPMCAAAHGWAGLGCPNTGLPAVASLRPVCGHLPGHPRSLLITDGCDRPAGPPGLYAAC